MIEPYCVKSRLYEGEPKTWIMRWWFRVNTKLECLGGRDRAPVDALGIYPGQGGQWVLDSQTLYTVFKPAYTSVVFSLTTAPLTDDPFSLSSSCHMHKDPYFWRLAYENLHTRDLVLVG
jgi:hypothetical protein